MMFSMLKDIISPPLSFNPPIPTLEDVWGGLLYWPLYSGAGATDTHELWLPQRMLIRSIHTHIRSYIILLIEKKKTYFEKNIEVNIDALKLLFAWFSKHA